MNDNCPICPHCITEIPYDVMTDDYYDASVYETVWRGTCPVCGRHFTWKEVYCYSRLEDFEEEVDNG